MKKYKEIIVLVLVIIEESLSSCDDIFDKLAVNPNQQDVNSFCNTSENINKGVVGIYSYITTPHTMGISATHLMANRGDESSDCTDYGVSGQYSVSLTSFWYTIVQPYQLFYTVASQACQMIEVIPDIEFSNEKLENGYLGEAYFLHAFSHCFLLLSFCNIPLMEHFPKSYRDYKWQSAPEDTWDFIISDLKKAKGLFTKKIFWTGDNTGGGRALPLRLC